MLTRPIPSTKEPLPVVGLGTWQTFDVGADRAALDQRKEVLRILFEAGGRVIDSSPMYGRAEEVVGTLLAEMGARDKAFLATKVWTSGEAAGIEQMQASAAKLQAPAIDLMQIHNLVDWRTHLRDAARLEGAEAVPLHRHHPLHRSRARRAGGHHPRRAHRLRAVRLLDRQPRRRGAPAAAVRRARRRRHRQSALRQRRAVRPGARQGAARLGRGRRLRQLEPVLPQVHPRSPRRHLRHPRHGHGPTTLATTSPPARAACPTPPSASAWRSFGTVGRNRR